MDRKLISWRIQPGKYFDLDYNMFSRLNLVYNDICYDRFGLIDFANPYNVLKFDNLPQYNNNDVCLQNIILDQAKSILEKYNRIAVAWSGGVDSTGIIASLLLNGCNPNRLTIIHTSKSIEEYPLFYHYLIKNDYELINNDQSINDPVSVYENLDTDVILFGWGADQLYHYYKIYNQKDIANEDWKNSLKSKYKPTTIKFIDEDIDVLQYYQEKLDWKCDTFFEFSLMCNLCLKMTGLRNWFQNLCHKQQTRNKTVMFYINDRFTNWGYCNRKLTKWYFEQNNPLYYKPEIKQLIYQLTKDDQYLKYKAKVPSWGKQYQNEDLQRYSICLHDDTGYYRYEKKYSKLIPDQQLLIEQCKMFNQIMTPYRKHA